MHRSRLIPLSISLQIAACGGDAYFYSDKDEGGAAPQDGDSSTWDGDAGGTDGDTTWEPEEEAPFGGLQPASIDGAVFIANPDRDTLTRVSVPSLEVLTVEVGVHPAVVSTTPDQRTAVVFNEGSDEVSIVDTGTLALTQVAVRDDLNQLVMSPDGRFVICYHDEDAVDPDDPDPEGAQSFNEVSLVELASGTHTPMVVGFDPKQVLFTDDGSRAVVVSDAYLAVIDLDASPPALSRIPLTDDAVDPPVAEEVVLAANGSVALVRQFGAVQLLAVDLSSEQVTPVEVGANPTDLDVLPDGIHAVAVARTDRELWIYDLSDLDAPAEVLSLPPGMVVGSVEISPAGDLAILYSTAAGESLYATWDMNEADPIAAIQIHSLVKQISNVHFSGSGGTAVFLHPDEDGVDVDPTSIFAGEWALTMVDMSDQFQSPLRLAAEVSGFADADDGSTAFFIMDGEPWLELLDYGSMLYDEVALPSQPRFVGVMEGSHLAWVSQDHDLGRISFYDADGDTLETVTGFELNDGIVVH